MARDLPLFVLLDASFFMRRRMRGISEGAQLLFIRALGLAKLLISDGFIAESQIDLIALSSQTEQAESIGELIGVGLWIACDNGWQIDDWDRWNDSRDDISEKRRKASAMGNHSKWKHDEKPSSECVICQEQGLVPTPSNLVSDSDSQTDRKRTRKSSLEIETETKEEIKTKPFESDFIELSNLYRKKTDKAKARTAYQARRRAGTTHVDIMRSARGYLEAKKDTETNFLKSLAVFLNGAEGPWSEYLDAPSAATIAACPECHCIGNHPPDCSLRGQKDVH